MPPRVERAAAAPTRSRRVREVARLSGPRTKDYERLSFELNEALACARVCIEAALSAEDELCKKPSTAHGEEVNARA